MKIISMVVDNLEHVNYRVEYITERLHTFDKVIWFGSDSHQCELLEDRKKLCSHKDIKIVNSGHKIHNGMDFAWLQDFSFKYIKEKYDPDIYAFQSADELLTQKGIDFVEDWIVSSDEQFALLFSMSNKLFCETFGAQLVFQIFRKGQEYRSNNGLSDNIRFCNDVDMNTNLHYTNLGYSDQEEDNLVIDTGYLDAYACYQKTKNWGGRLCYHDQYTDELIKLWENGDKEAFIKLFVKKARAEFHGATDKKITPVKYEGEYKKMIDDLNLKEEYDFTRKVLREM